MRIGRRFSWVWLGLAALTTGCPPSDPAQRDGGTACQSTADCNPAGQICGLLRLCVVGFCTDTQEVVACRDGGYGDAVAMGNCATYEDCNPPGACGVVDNCVDFVCDPTMQIRIPCPDAGTDAGDASADGGTDSGATDGADGSDATTDGNADPG